MEKKYFDEVKEVTLLLLKEYNTIKASSGVSAQILNENEIMNTVLPGSNLVSLKVRTRTVQHTIIFPLPIRTDGRSCPVVPEVKIHLRRCSGDRIGASTASLRPLQAQNGILHNKMTVALQRK